jgi:hypothetical protein
LCICACYALSGGLQGGTGGQALLHSGPPDAVQPPLGLEIVGWPAPRCLVAADAETQMPITSAAESAIIVLLNILYLPAELSRLGAIRISRLVTESGAVAANSKTTKRLGSSRLTSI